MEFYFAGSIRAGRDDLDLYKGLIDFLKEYGTVLTEHVGMDGVEELESRLSDEEIFKRDVGWIKDADIFIAEVSLPSFGVGYEVATAESLGKPVYLLFREGCEKPLSAMAAGNSQVCLIKYDDLDEAKKRLSQEFLVYEELVE